MTPGNLLDPTEIANNARHLTSPGDQGARDHHYILPPSGLINVQTERALWPWPGVIRPMYGGSSAVPPATSHQLGPAGQLIFIKHQETLLLTVPNKYRTRVSIMLNNHPSSARTEAPFHSRSPQIVYLIWLKCEAPHSLYYTLYSLPTLQSELYFLQDFVAI